MPSLQVDSPEDISNFDRTNTDAGWAKLVKRRDYTSPSTDMFHDF